MNNLKMVLGIFDVSILLCLLENKDPMPAFEIHELLEEKTGKEISINGLYVAIGRLKRKEMVFIVNKVIPSGIKGGKPKRTYILSEKGRKQVEKDRNLFLSMLGKTPVLDSL